MILQRAAIAAEREELKARYRMKPADQYRTYLAELRRQRNSQSAPSSCSNCWGAALQFNTRVC